MRFGVTIPTIALLIALVWVSGCSNLFLGSTQVADFGSNTAVAQGMQNYLLKNYGDPSRYTGPPHFLEPMVSDGISNGAPSDKVTKFSKNTPTVYAWAFYEGFKPGDKVSATWMYNGKQYAQLAKQVAGNYGIVYGQFDKPESGWALGTHTITISGNGVQGNAVFDIIDGPTQTVPLPYQGSLLPAVPTGGTGGTTSGCTHDVYVYDGVDYAKSKPLTSIRVNVFGKKTLESGYNVPDDWVTSAYTDASGYAKLTIPDSAFSKYQYFVVLPEIPAGYERAGVQTSTGTTSVQGTCPHVGPVTLFVNLDPYTSTALCGGKSEFWFAQKTDDIMNQCSVTGSLARSQLAWGESLVVTGSSTRCTSPVIIFKLAKGTVSAAPPADAYNIGSAQKNTNNEYTFTWDTGQGKQTFGLTDGQYTVFAINPTNDRYVSLPVTIGPGTGPAGCTISATAMRYALGLGRTTPEQPKLGWGDYVQFSGTVTNCVVPVSLRIKGSGLPAQGVMLISDNDDVTHYPIAQNGPFTIRWGTYQLGGKNWKDYPVTQAVYTATFVDTGGNEYSPLQLDFTNPPACVITASMDLAASIDPAAGDVSWTHPVTIRGSEDYCTAGLKFTLQKKSDLLSHPGDSSWIYQHGMNIGTAPPSTYGYTFVWNPRDAQQQYSLTDDDYVVFIMNAAGTEYTKVGFPIVTNPASQPATTIPTTATPIAVPPRSGPCYHDIYAYDGVKPDTSRGFANVLCQIFGSNEHGSYYVANQIGAGTTDASGHVLITIPDSELARWSYFFVNCAGVTPTNGYRNAGARSSTGTTSTPVSLGYEIINPYISLNVCGGTSEYWFSRVYT